MENGNLAFFENTGNGVSFLELLLFNYYSLLLSGVIEASLDY